MRHWSAPCLVLALVLLWGSPPAHAQMSACPGVGKGLEPVASEVLTVSTAVVPLTAATITNNAAAAAFISLEGTTSLRFTLVGVPSATVGHLIDPPSGGNANAISSTWFCGRATLLALRLIRGGSSDVTLRVTYFRAR